jgi:hypothetical protein
MYKWVFVVATIVFLGGAYYLMKRSPTPLNRWSFYGTAVLSVALLIYTYLYR